ncbi:MAG: hypothetical protein A2W31_17570, partial [Planctomycetes bacterium RBG_16_64_10]
AVTGRLVERHAGLVQRGLWPVAGSLVALVGAVAALEQGGRALHERQALAALPNPAPTAPNVLLLVLDTVRADALGAYGNQSHRTPQLDQFALGGVVFDHAHSTSPWTLPAHGGLFTGRLPHELSGDWLAPLDDRFPTLAQQLARAGYVTAGFVGNTRYCSAETGLARGFAHYEDYGLSPADFAFASALARKFLLSSIPARFGYYNWPGRKSAAQVNRQFLDWLSGQPGRPFFAFLNYWDAHDPYLAPPPFAHWQTASHAQRCMLRDWWWMEKQDLSAADIERVRSAHDDCVHYLDAQVGALLAALERRGVLDRTLVVVVADHGEHFGDHGLFAHGNSLYQPLLQVPLMMAWPGHIPPRRRVSEPVSLAQLPATITALIGVDGEPFDGRPLTDCWADGRPDRPVAGVVSEIALPAKFPPCHGRSPIARGAMKSIRTGPIKYIRSATGAEELYDLETDPGEQHNLVAAPAWRPQLERLRTELTRMTEPAGL